MAHAGLLFLVAMLATVTTHANEAQRLVDRLLAPPNISAAPGFSARLLVAPGTLYDPLIMLPQGDAVWLNDDGGEEGEKGSRLLRIDRNGGITTLAGIGKLLPTVGFDIAPAGFGAYAGQVFTLAQARTAMPGALANHVVQRVDPQRDFEASVFCTLPDAGTKKTPGFGLDARFGPHGSPFANRLFVVTILNDTIYQVSADGACTPFIVFDGKTFSGPTMLNFTPDGGEMLVTVSRGVFDIESSEPPQGAIVRVSADGKIVGEPLFEGRAKPMGMAYAPESFGEYGGQLFFSDVGQYQIPVPMTQAMIADGRILRLQSDGGVAVVASGFINPIGVQFFDGKLWVTDINGDFIAGRRELPDGFMVEIGVR